MSMEIWDLYDVDGNPTGRRMVRAHDIPAGYYHLVCEVLVRHVDGDYLLMRRSLRKDVFPGCWEATAGGSALAGEDALTCIRRELREETGIVARDFEQVARLIINDDTIFYTWLCVTDWDKNAVTLQEGETMDFRWVSEKEFIAYLHSDQVVTTQRDRWTDWYRKMGYIQ